MSALRYLAAAVNTENSGKLKPINQIVKSNSSQWDWESHGDDPAFMLKFKLPLSVGWYMIELNMRGEVNAARSCLYFDMGDGFNETDSADLQWSHGSKCLKRLVYIRKKCQMVRFDPIEAPGHFSVDSLRLVPVSRQFSLTRRLTRIHKNIDKINNISYEQYKLIATLAEKELKQFIQEEAQSTGVSFEEKLQRFYVDTFDSESETYQRWMRKFEEPLFDDLSRLKKGILRFKRQPLISIVMPVYNTDEKYLCNAIESVLAQAYENWELCIVDDASSLAHIKPLLERYTSHDARIKVVFSTENEHIAGASNRALSIATGDYIAFLDHDDVLAAHALYAVVESINNNPDSQVIYSDEDKIDAEGVRSNPHFKSDWNQDLFYSYNYLCHFTVIDRQLISAVNGFRSGVDGSQDYDLLLRVIKQASFENITHIPHVLYHWRAIEGSTAAAPDQKGYTTTAGIKALQDHFDSLGQRDVIVERSVHDNLYRVKHPIPENPPLVSLLIPTRNGYDYLKACVDGIIEKTEYQHYEIIILDNQSDEEKTLRYLRQIEQSERVRVERYDDEFNYSAINNFGVRFAKGEVIGLINNDIEVIDGDWLGEMVSQVCRENIGCVGAKLLYEDKTVQHAGVIVGVGGVAGHCFLGLSSEDFGYFSRAQLVQNLSAVTAACLLVKKSVFDEVKGLDEENFKVAFNDVDLCLKVREAGYRNLWTPHATLFHYESKSRGYEDTPKKRKRFKSEIAAMKLKWSPLLNLDPYYSPNLTVKGTTYTLRN